MSPMATRARGDLTRVLGRHDVLSLAFGAMVGWGWVVLAGDMIARAGTLGSALAYDFAASGTSQSQVIRVPNYTDVTVQSGGVLTVNAWDGSTGGVMFFRATGAVDVQSGGELTVAGRGFTGGAGGAARARSSRRAARRGRS